MKIIYKNKIGSFNGIGQVEDGQTWTVCKGSLINPIVSNSISPVIKAIRDQKGLIVNNILQEDVSFKSASTAAQFVSGYSANGMREWRTIDGKHISEYIKGRTKNPKK